MQKITLEQRKLLTEWLDECWHECTEAWFNGIVLQCLKCGAMTELSNRTFDNWTDFGAVVEKLQESKITDDPWFVIDTIVAAYDKYDKLIPERFCILVAEAIKEGVIK